jgi:hypothetical protein
MGCKTKSVRSKTKSAKCKFYTLHLALCICRGTLSRNRTGTNLRSLVFETNASTYSAIRANEGAKLANPFTQTRDRVKGVANHV